MEKSKVTFREYLHVHNSSEEDIDVYVDGTSAGAAICFGELKLTPEGNKYFADCLDKLYVEGNCIVSYNNDDYDKYDQDEGGIIGLAVEFIYAQAGFCSCEDFENWFEGSSAELL